MITCMVCGHQEEKSILSHVRNKHGITAKEYKMQYPGSALRESWLRNNPEALKNFVETVSKKNRDRLKGKPGLNSLHGLWSKKYLKCSECGTTKSPHISNGICKRCFNKHQRRKITEQKNSTLLRGTDNIDYVVCKICGLPFKSLTTNGHLKTHNLTEKEYATRFKNAKTRCEKTRSLISENVSRGRKLLMQTRGYLNPPSARDKKRKEMSLRHATLDFCKVSISERMFADWLLSNGYKVLVGKKDLKENEIAWQFPILDKYCVDFFVPTRNICVEILGDWWHGKDFLDGKLKMQDLHATVRRNIHLDKIRFEEIEKSGVTLIKIWSSDIKKIGFETLTKGLFPKIGDQVTSSSLDLFSEALIVAGQCKKSKVHLSKVVWTTAERFNARWLQKKGLISIDKKSYLSVEDAARLRAMLTEYGDKPAISEEEINKNFVACREVGFPYDSTDGATRLVEYSKLLSADIIPKGGFYNWVGQETKLATSFHKHFYECKRKGKISPLDFFNDDICLKRGIIKAISLNGFLTPSSLRSICRNEDAVSHINNFPPRVAMSIIKDLFPERNDLLVLDPCAGFSGRQIGCAASGKVAEYCGIDISEFTYNGLLNAASFLEEAGSKTKFDLHLGDCLSIMPSLQKNYNLCLTSPPFFDIEEYKGVSIEKNYFIWLSSFLRPFIKGIFDRLVSGGKMAIYLDSTAERDIQKDFIQISKDQGFVQKEPVVFKCGRGVYQRTKDKFKMIEITVWEKPS